MSYKKRLIFILFIFTSNVLLSQKFYAIIIADVEDNTIGQSCMVDQTIMRAQLKAAAEGIGYEFVIENITGSKFNSDQINNSIRKLRCNSQDIIVVYYTGHGVNPEKRKTKWPAIDLRNKTGDYIPLDAIHKTIKNKGARLVITIGDCCNKSPNVINAEAKNLIVEDLTPEKNTFYSDLFIKNSGDILISSCMKDQYSYSNNEKGSYFTAFFNESFVYALNYGDDISWNSILCDTKTRMKKLDFSTGKQTPQYEINLGNIPTPSPEVVKYETVNEYLNLIIDTRNESSKRRLFLKDKKKYFIDRAVVKLFKNTTMVDVMPIEDYLNRIYLMASKIQSINYIENQSVKNSMGKIEQLVIQEIWE